jgi:hypothetical protein
MSLRLLGLLLVLHVLVGWAFLSGAGPGFPLDDAWGHLVYGRAFAQGEGFAYNPGQPEAGVSAPLWTLLAAIPAGAVEWTGWIDRPDGGMRLLGGLFGLLLAAVGCRLAGRAGRWPAICVALMLSTDPLLLAGRFSGMELPLFGLLTLLLVEALLDHRPTAAGWRSGLLVLTRPEGLALAAVAGLVLARRGRELPRFLLPLLICVLPFAAWNQWVAGHPWPNTWSNKFEAGGELAQIVPTLAALGADTGWGWALLLMLFTGAVALSGAVRELPRLLLTLAAVLLIGVLATRSMPLAFEPPRVPFYWQRYALLAWPPVLVVAGAGLASLARTAWAGLYCRPLAAVALIGPALLVGILGRSWPQHALETRERFAAECADVEALNVAAGLWINEHLPVGSLVATHDAGAVRYFGRREVLDIYGNNDSLLNALIDERQRASEPAQAERAQRAVLDYLRQRNPDALAVFPIAWAAAHSPELAALSPEERASLMDQVDDYAGFLGLTRRAVTFRVARPAVVDSPIHQTFAIFVRP